jgi:hypothetical protein
MKQRIFVFAVVLAALMALPGGALANGVCTHALVAGQFTDVGSVTVSNDSANIYVNLEVDQPYWRITEVHIHVAAEKDDVPQTKAGNPKVGKFAHSEELDAPVTSYEWSTGIPTDTDGDGNYFVLAHAVVCYDNTLADVEDSLPDTVTMKVKYPYSGGPSYFETTISGGTDIDGTYEGWCVDTDHTIGQGSYTAQVYSSYESLPADLIEYPENLDLVNWILNQGYVGTTSPGGFGTYTYGDVQRAIWDLIEDGQSTSGLGQWNGNRVDEILTAAHASGEDFFPGCGDVIAIVLRPVNANGGTTGQVTIAQVTLAELPVECGESTCETAWGDGTDFGGSSWAMYIGYTLATCP